MRKPYSRSLSGRRTATRLLAAIAALALLAVSCSDDDGGGGDGSGGGDDAQDRELPSGEPIVVGFMSLEDSAIASFPESRESAQAAVDYINYELGGVDGRPIQLEVCVSSGSPEESEACANQILEADPVAVTGGADLGTDVSLPIYAAAGVSLAGTAPVGLAEYTADNSYLFVGGTLAEFGAQVMFIDETLEAQKVAILHADIPQGALAATTFGEDLLEEVGITDVTLVPEDQNATDFTASLSVAAEGDPDVIMVMLAGQACAGIMQAAQSLGIEAAMTYSGGCTDQSILETASTAADGSYFSTEMIWYDDTSDADVKTFREALDEYGDGDITMSMLAQMGFSNVMNLYNLFVEMGGENITPEALTEALNATEDQPNFMAHPYTCNREQVSFAPAVCDAHALILQLEDGEMSDVGGGWISGAELL
ncbi:MAG: hypothetical protein JJLCMIEE_01093 [Acidimicrobiales bacterium]|nr:MAG: hypothetical protein EDR02_11660 [Actinomycetota bacterium]MBV6508034.1 hypothetical protein [Acidimicrobiales bacterium]RIK05337.1 MAG: hypothetical protein DCC48_10700 [Acidobacteriota bacterium]